jgi:hypothetical protein
MCITWSLAALDAATTAVAASHATTEPVITSDRVGSCVPFPQTLLSKENRFKLLKGLKFNFLRGIFLATMAAHRSGDAGLVEVSMLQRPRRNRKVLNQQSEHVFLQNGHATTTSILLAWAATRLVFVCPFWAVSNELKQSSHEVTASTHIDSQQQSLARLTCQPHSACHAALFVCVVCKDANLRPEFLELHASPHTLLHFVRVQTECTHIGTQAHVHTPLTHASTCTRPVCLVATL